MNGIELKDIISEDSDAELDEDEKMKMEEKKNTPGYEQYMKCLGKTTHPLDHYNGLKVEKKGDEDKKKEGITSPTSMSDRFSQMT